MKILSPIDNAAEAEALLDAGADELYGGYVSPAWRRKFSMLGSLNQRYFPNAQIEGMAALRKIIRAAHSRGAMFYLTLNAPYYIESQYDAILKEAARMKDIGVDAFIAADLGLILRLRENMPDAGVHLSTMSSVFNSRAASFFSRLGVGRMVFPRDLTLSEMAAVARANPDVSFDAFVMVGKCPNIEGFCSFTHCSPEIVWPCEERYEVKALEADSRFVGIKKAQAGWSRVNRRQACGLCAVRGLTDAGVTGLKLVGRGGPTAVKVGVIRAVRQMAELSDGGASDTRLKRRGKALYKEVFGRGCSRYICYFPELWAGKRH